MHIHLLLVTYFNLCSNRFGETAKPASYEIGNCAWETPYKPPSHGGKSEVKNFFDKSHLNVHSY